jgi:SAM-dependent methyltransferase
MRKILGQGFFIGVEYAFELIQHARYSPDKMEIVQADVSTLPFDIKTAFFDIVVALAILEHLHHPEKVVRQAQELLSPGGLFIATSPNPVWDLISQSPKFGKREYHVNKMGTKKMIQVVKDAGLELVSFEPFMWAPLGFLPYLNIWVDPDFSLSADRFIRNLYVTNWLFVNACVVGRKSEK